MTPLTAIALSGMNASLLRMNVAGHNIANAVTPVYRRQLVNPETQAGGGVAASVKRAAEPGSDLAADAVGQMMALYTFKANLGVVRVEREMLGSLLDVTA